MSVVVTEPVPSGLVLVKTTLGDILIELFSRETPKACRNFVQLALEGYYDGLPFHRIVPGFIAQTGDASGTGTGGESIYDDGEFEDEFNQRLKFNRRGLVAMANLGRRNTNLSQFFFTLDVTTELQNKNTIFGRVAAGDTLFNVLKLGEVELEPGTDRPVFPPKIKSVEVKDNPFEDIVPRITAKERKEQEKAKREMKIERAKQREQGKRKGTKNKSLLSFGAEPEEEEVDPSLAKAKFKSAHDVLEDSRLSKQVLDDRGTSATLPEGMEGPARKRKIEESNAIDSKRGKTEAPPTASTSSLSLAREAKKKADSNPNEKLQKEIAKMQQDLKKMSKNGGKDSDDSDDDGKGKKKKAKRTGPSLLQLEREKYAKSAGGKKKKGQEEDLDLGSILDGFRTKIHQTKEVEREEKAEGADERYGIDEDDSSGDEGWLAHRLKFRKDATLDQHTTDEYSLHDPLAKNSESLAEIKAKQDNRRQYAGDRRDDGGRSGGGGGGRRDDDRRRGDGGSRGGGGGRDDRYGGRRDEGRRSDGKGERAEVHQSSWKGDRVSRSDLA